MNTTYQIIDFTCERLGVDQSLLESMIDAPRGAVATWIKTNRISTKYEPKITALLTFMATCSDMGINRVGDDLSDLLFDIVVDTTIDASIANIPSTRDGRDIKPGDKKITLLKYMTDGGDACDMRLVRRLIEYHIFKKYYEPRFDNGLFSLIN